MVFLLKKSICIHEPRLLAVCVTLHLLKRMASLVVKSMLSGRIGIESTRQGSGPKDIVTEFITS